MVGCILEIEAKKAGLSKLCLLKYKFSELTLFGVGATFEMKTTLFEIHLFNDQDGNA
jgi:hypothetical protein